MKLTKMIYGLSLMLLLSISFSSMPLSLLHHHEHENDCDIASSIPQKFKREKDLYPKHYHTFEAACFLCFENHLTKTYSNILVYSTPIQAITFKYTESIVAISTISIIDLKGRDPPAANCI